MIFVDTNVFMYAVGGPHPLQQTARHFLLGVFDGERVLVTSAEVLQELLHAYLPVSRRAELDRAFTLIESCTQEIWSVEPEDIRLAWALADTHPALAARDLVHLATCTRRSVTEVMTFNRRLASAFVD
ncbi:MAG: ribonuclease [Gemmatimonas sp. SG8_23]|nr:MAG: ribonuclease [Gemmatimonas sp. SG8_23]